jgi:hypothetical protein
MSSGVRAQRTGPATVSTSPAFTVAARIVPSTSASIASSRLARPWACGEVPSAKIPICTWSSPGRWRSRWIFMSSTAFVNG